MSTDKRNRTIAVIVTTTIHALLVVLLIKMALCTPLPLPSESGVEVNLGMYNQGMGTSNTKAIASKEIVETRKPEIKKETVTQETEDTPAIDMQEQHKKEEPKVNQRALFKAPTAKEQDAQKGITEQPGIQGKDNGLQNINRYDGNGGNNGGTSFSLDGRGALKLTVPDSDFQYEGVIVVTISVDKEGKVIEAHTSKGTTITDKRLQKTAVDAAMTSRFTPNPDAEDYQTGTITYNFKITK
ncbi:MAG: energy transducer TonB [Candidatus Limimorpha sp.]